MASLDGDAASIRDRDGRDTLGREAVAHLGQTVGVFSFDAVTPEAIACYRENGFVSIRGVVPHEEALAWREVAIQTSASLSSYSDNPVFTQTVNVWTRDDRMEKITLDSRLAAAAKALAGGDLRIWHDQILIKQPQNRTPTEFHQDQPYWPHLHSPDPISLWLSLGEASVEAGCMTFIPGSHRYRELAAQDLGDAGSLFGLCPELAWEPRVTLPLHAGDCTFHHGRCAHMAGANQTDSPRVAHVVIYINAATRFSGAGHVVTDPLGLRAGDSLEGELFPRV